MAQQETQLKEQEYAAIGAIARLFLSDAPLEHIGMAVATLLARRLDVAAIDISLYDGMVGEIATLCAAGCTDKISHHPKIPLRQSIYKDVIEKQLVITGAKKIDPDCWRNFWLAELQPAALVLAPMRMQGRAIGALGIADTRAHADIKGLAELGQTIADYLAQEVMRKMAKRELQKKEVFFRTMVDYQTEFVCRMAPDTTFRFVNETYLRYLEKFQEEIVGNKLIDLVDEADKAVFAAQVQTLHAREQAISVEHRWMTPAGDARRHRWILRMLHDENGRPVEMLGVGRDITDEKKTQDILKAREAQYRAVVEDQTELIARFKYDGTIIFANESYCRYLRIQSSDIIGKRFMPLVLPEDKEKISAQMKSLTAENPVSMIDCRLSLPDGSWRWTQWSFLVIVDEKKNITEYQAVGRDIHEIKQLQAMLQAMFDGITDPIFMLDENCIVKMANKATLDYYRVATADFINRPCYEAFRPQKDICRSCDITAKLNRNEVTTYERTDAIGHGTYEQVTVYPLRLSGIDVSSAIIHIKDVTKTRLLEKRVSHSERLASLGLLISGIAHEINNPNNFIAFNIPVLRYYLRVLLPITDEHWAAHPDFAPFGMPYPEFKGDLFRLLENMEHGSDRINRTVSGLREFTSNQGAKELVWADMHTVVDRAVMLCGSKVKNAVRSFDVSVDDAAAKTYTDPYALEHMLIILLMNAAQAVDKTDSFIRVSVRRGASWQEHTIIEVADNGCGITPENRDKLFDPFFTTKASSGGTGLGLYICKDMINGLGGRIEIISEPGAGATFQLVLPDISATG